ncbi:MAG: hypothetical protein NTX87_06585 [Planctomycetota bacterium]|nr:hypothetical protein [Planctomycetota bacterium]
MATYEQERLRKILKDHDDANRLGEQLVFNARDGRIRVVGGNDPDRSNLTIGPAHVGFSAEVKAP